MAGLRREGDQAGGTPAAAAAAAGRPAQLQDPRGEGTGAGEHLAGATNNKYKSAAWW